MVGGGWDLKICPTGKLNALISAKILLDKFIRRIIGKVHSILGLKTMKKQLLETHFVLCIENSGCEDLEKGVVQSF